MMKLNEMLEKATTWTKSHKKEILIGVATAVGGYAIYKVVGGKIFKSEPVAGSTLIEEITQGTDNLEIPDIGVGTVTDFWLEGGELPHAIVNDLTLADMGKLGEGLAKVGEVAEEGAVSAVICMTKSAET